MKKVKLLTFSLCFAAMNVWAADVYVTTTGAGDKSGSNWANAKDNLGDVLYKATTGTTVHVGAGVYHPTVDYLGNASAANNEKRFKFQGGVNVLGGYPAAGGEQRDPKANETILDGGINDTDTVYTIAYALLNEQEAVVDGFVFRNATGRKSGPNNDYFGDFSGGAGALIVENGTTEGVSTPAGKGIKLVDCTFNGFTAQWGGAIKLKRPDQTENPKMTLERCTFTNNVSGQNGGGILAYSWNFDIKDCTFENNNGGGSGAGIHTEGPLTINAESSVFKGGKVTSNGAGICNWTPDAGEGEEQQVSTVTVKDCEFTNNNGWDGVGVYCNHAKDCVVEGCTFDGNTGGGAGVIRFNGTFSIADCTFKANKITNHPGGWLDGNTGSISRCIYINNEGAAGAHGAMFKVQMGGQIDITDCYATGNTAKSIAAIGWGSQGTMKNVSIVNNNGTAVAFQGANYTIQNMTITGNTSVVSGAVIDGSWEGGSSIKVYDCTIADNTSADGQNALFCSAGTADIEFDNCIYVQNGDDEVDYGTIFTSFIRNYSIWGNMLYGEGRFTPIDPFTIGTYLDPIKEINGQYVLELIGDDNPAVGAGSPNSAGTLDQLGQKRPEYPSIGAVEKNPAGESSIPDVSSTFNELVAYPSLTTGQLVVRCPSSTGTELSIYATNGKLVRRIMLSSGDNLLELSDLTEGTYILNTQTAGKVFSANIIKK